MELTGIGKWEVLMNVSGFLLWGMTIVYMIRKDAKNGNGFFRRKVYLKNCGKEKNFSEILMKQSEVAFNRNLEGINYEKTKLHDILKEKYDDKYKSCNCENKNMGHRTFVWVTPICCGRIIVFLTGMS
ncbi:hypothetical protein PITCH_A2430002 [uncultured Desulfobacterium sp.]|uniref:Uncharacterized protein n=1 Tax=uncultured Desulfobacterium sp. TaxID=201089 RepID=A0A445MYK8_9BACT|nr:hypothetical protein PITCH_A2430001 [uncultured Desulfobacterium sp.]SPD74567.1 hypothetical protein PITCH_A2430002 [uncultured Desulfobacterium sp.]